MRAAGQPVDSLYAPPRPKLRGCPILAAHFAARVGSDAASSARFPEQWESSSDRQYAHDESGPALVNETQRARFSVRKIS